MKQKTGRPKGTTGPYKEITRDVTLAFKVTEEEAEKIKTAAKEVGISVSNYVRKAVLEK